MSSKIDLEALNAAVGRFLNTLSGVPHEHHASEYELAEKVMTKFVNYMTPVASADEVAALKERIAQLESDLGYQQGSI